jgi:hypothetical protein
LLDGIVPEEGSGSIRAAALALPIMPATGQAGDRPPGHAMAAVKAMLHAVT